MEILVSRSSMPWVSLWTLSAYGRKFYLGQDVKFCDRVLNIAPRDLVKQIGSNHIYRKTINLRLARFICNELNINRSTVKQLDAWQLAAD
jgi:hypothetical protein